MVNLNIKGLRVYAYSKDEVFLINGVFINKTNYYMKCSLRY